MARGSINHLALTVSDLVRSTEFYDKLLGFMGYVRVEVPEATQPLMKTRLHAWTSPNGSITLRPAKGSAGRAHDRNAPGLNIRRAVRESPVASSLDKGRFAIPRQKPGGRKLSPIQRTRSLAKWGR
jgi:catechol 2,3-dioxygenase-like lactoylglutathione lyase family enzyme